MTKPARGGTAWRRFLRVFRKLVVPEGVVLAVAAAALAIPTTRSAVAPMLPYYPLLVAAAGVFLAARFRSGRLLLALLVLALAERALAGLAGEPGVQEGPGGPAFQAVALLLPLTLAWLAAVRERGLFTRSGGLRLLVVGAEAALVVFLSTSPGSGLAELLRAELVPAAWTAWTPLGQPALLATLVVVGSLAGWQLVRPRPYTRGFLWATVAALTALHADASGATVHLATGGLLLLVATIESSHAMAYRDGLTGLPTRRVLEEDLLRLGPVYTLAVADVDRFKAFNDTYGHDVGDQVLRMVAARLREAPGRGRAYRYGGEEFVLLFPGLEPNEAAPHLEEVRRSVEESVFVLRGPDRPDEKPEDPERHQDGGHEELSVTVSIGAAGPGEGRASPAEVLEAADRALYEAKEGGRNRVVA